MGLSLGLQSVNAQLCCLMPVHMDIHTHTHTHFTRTKNQMVMRTLKQLPLRAPAGRRPWYYGGTQGIMPWHYHRSLRTPTPRCGRPLRQVVSRLTRHLCILPLTEANPEGGVAFWKQMKKMFWMESQNSVFPHGQNLISETSGIGALAHTYVQG